MKRISYAVPGQHTQHTTLEVGETYLWANGTVWLVISHTTSSVHTVPYVTVLRFGHAADDCYTFKVPVNNGYHCEEVL